MDDLVVWLRAQLDEVERRTRKLLAHVQRTTLTLKDPRHLGKWMPGWHDWPDVEQMCVEWLAEVEAKRRIIDVCEPDHRFGEASGDDTTELATETLRLLALPSADRPGYRVEWRPQ